MGSTSKLSAILQSLNDQEALKLRVGCVCVCVSFERHESEWQTEIDNEYARSLISSLR